MKCIPSCLLHSSLHSSIFLRYSEHTNETAIYHELLYNSQLLHISIWHSVISNKVSHTLLHTISSRWLWNAIQSRPVLPCTLAFLCVLKGWAEAAVLSCRECIFSFNPQNCDPLELGLKTFLQKPHRLDFTVHEF